MRELFCSKYDIASTEGDRTKHKPLPWTGLDSKGCVCHPVRQWVMKVMARSSGQRVNKSVWYKILFSLIFNIDMFTYFKI